jgi:chromosome segregation and condensation protein ScpB
MQLKPKTFQVQPVYGNKTIEAIMKSPRKFVTEEQLAEILGLNVNKAVIKAVELKFARIPVKNSRYYSKKQIQAYLNKEYGK